MFWNVGFFPTKDLAALCDPNGGQVQTVIGGLAAELGVHIVAGSAATVRSDGRIYNTASVFDRNGTRIATYDKTHLFSPMGEDQFFQRGDRLVDFTLDGVKCGILICYEIRFPELARTLALRGVEILFVVAQWTNARLGHWEILTRARAIENQLYVVCTNSCGTAGATRYAGHSALIDPWGEVSAVGGDNEEILTATLDPELVHQVRRTIDVYRDRRPDLYGCLH